MPPVAALPGSAHLHVRVKPGRILAPAPAIVETLLFSRVGHTFKPHPLPPPLGPSGYLVQDFLFEQTGASGADGKMKAQKSFDLTTAVTYRLEVFPKDRRRRITVKAPAVNVYVGLDAGRLVANPSPGHYSQYPAFPHFVNVAGPSPLFTYQSFFITQGTNDSVTFTVQGQLVDSFSCGGFVVEGHYPPRTFNPGLQSYRPLSYSLPFNLPGPNSVPYLMFSYLTQNAVDPGPFVFLEPPA